VANSICDELEKSILASVLFVGAGVKGLLVLMRNNISPTS
jgi:hypothetical protein